MTDIEFFAVVAKMRQSQKKFFATRSNDPISEIDRLCELFEITPNDLFCDIPTM